MNRNIFVKLICYCYMLFVIMRFTHKYMLNTTEKHLAKYYKRNSTIIS